jgi:hypothetical protein
MWAQRFLSFQNVTILYKIKCYLFLNFDKSINIVTLANFFSSNYYLYFHAGICTETVEAERKNKKCKCIKYYCTLLRNIHYESIAERGGGSLQFINRIE